jgi:hypothetical protein
MWSGGGDLAVLQRAGDGGTANRGDEERSAWGRVLHEGVFRDVGGDLRGGVELQPALSFTKAQVTRQSGYRKPLTMKAEVFVGEAIFGQKEKGREVVVRFSESS